MNIGFSDYQSFKTFIYKIGAGDYVFYKFHGPEDFEDHYLSAFVFARHTVITLVTETDIPTEAQFLNDFPDAAISNLPTLS